MKPERIIQYSFAAFLLLGFFVLLGIMLYRPIPEQNKSVLEIVLGALAGSVVTVIAYYFGSSKGSSDKQEMLMK